MKNTSSLKSLSSKALNAKLNAAKKLEEQIRVELDNRLFDRQQVLKTKIKGLEGLARTVALFKPITTKRALATINSVCCLRPIDAAKVPNLKFYHQLSLNTEHEIRTDFYTKVPKIFAKDSNGNVYEYVERYLEGKLARLGCVKA